ncbi:MAG: hypothetical protein ACYTEZ_10020 [Planctomycetota bacterium]|jgi:hypothetical protein
MAEYRIRKRAPACCVSGEPFQAGDVIVSAIYEGPDGFERRDMREQHFDSSTRPFCHWRRTQPEEPGGPPKLDYDLALRFLDRLVREADPAREGLVYALTLLLSRKRRVKITETLRLPEGELLRVVVPGVDEDAVVQIRALRLSDDEVDGLQAELGNLFDLGGASAASEAE